MVSSPGVLTLVEGGGRDKQQTELLRDARVNNAWSNMIPGNLKEKIKDSERAVDGVRNSILRSALWLPSLIVSNGDCGSSSTNKEGLYLLRSYKPGMAI